MRRYLVRAFAAVVGFVALGAIGGVLYFWRSLPVVNGTEVVAGASAPIDIIRDADAIPHIFAATKADALFGLGYVHAQDRLWQMEFQRRIGHGRLSEVLGPAAVPQDRFLRTVGFGRAARTAWASTPEWAQAQVNAYVAGINAFIATHRGSALPPEFTLLRFEPEPFTGEDVTVWVKMMAWDLSANYSFELLRADLVSRVGAERMAQLMPPYPADGLSILGQSHRSPAREAAVTAGGSAGGGATSYGAALIAALSQGDSTVSAFLLGGATTESLGSNNWVVDGTLTASGRPLLANDPHLGTKVPSIWYLAHLSAPDFEIIGATLPGTPAVALGRNRFIAWGATNVAADVEDLYREHLDASGTHADFRGAPESVTVIPETIVVKGAPPVRVNVRVTRHGPLISDAINANNAESAGTPKPAPLEPLAFRWTALDPGDTTLASYLKLNEARTWSQFTEALRDYVAPSQNFVYADEDGHIGYYAPGHIPVRASGDGSLPAEGWTGTAEWTGWIPFGELPHLADPPEHFIVTANHRPAPPGYGHLLGLEWPEPYRARRITDLLTGRVRLQPSRDGSAFSEASADHGRRFTPDDFARIQADTFSLHASTLLPVLLAHARPERAQDRQAAGLLRRWTFDATASSVATTIFAAWFHHLASAFAGDDLGPLITGNYQGRFTFVTRFVMHTLATNDSRWCDDGRTTRAETCDETVTDALRQGVDDLAARLGHDMTRWRWDAVHRAVFPHQGLDAVSLLRPLLSRSVPNSGDWSTVNVGPVDAAHPYEQHSVAGYREIIDLSPANDSRFLDAVGQSGHPLSRHYDDFLSDWQNVRYRRMRMERAEIEKDALGRLRLTP
jgi:penicillin amidase